MKWLTEVIASFLMEILYFFFLCLYKIRCAQLDDIIFVNPKRIPSVFAQQWLVYSAQRKMPYFLLFPSLWQDASAANHSSLKAMHFLRKKHVSEIIINLFSSVMLKHNESLHFSGLVQIPAKKGLE